MVVTRARRGRLPPACRPGAWATMLAALLAGCAGPVTHGLPDGYAVESDADYGVVVGTVGVLPDIWLEWSRYEFRSLTEPAVSGHVTSAYSSNPFYMFGSMPLCADDGLERECGHAFALRLPAGEYRFTGVTPAMSSASTSTLDGGWGQLLEGYDFTVRPGRVVYIGSLLSRVCIGVQNGWAHSHRVWSAVGDVTDRYARDLPLLQRKYPTLAPVTVANETMRGPPWLWRYGERSGKRPLAGWPADCSLEPATLEAYLHSGE